MLPRDSLSDVERVLGQGSFLLPVTVNHEAPWASPTLMCHFFPSLPILSSMCNQFKKLIGDSQESDFPPGNICFKKCSGTEAVMEAGALRPFPCHSPLDSSNAYQTEFRVESYGFG